MSKKINLLVASPADDEIIRLMSLYMVAYKEANTEASDEEARESLALRMCHHLLGVSLPNKEKSELAKLQSASSDGIAARKILDTLADSVAKHAESLVPHIMEAVWNFVQDVKEALHEIQMSSSTKR